MIPLFTPHAVRAMDERAFARGLEPLVLMERAAAQLAHAVLRVGGRAYGLRVGLLCGKGNNGGDGIAAARRLRDAGAAPVVWLAGDEAGVSAETAVQLARWRAEGGRVAGELDRAIDGAEVLVDCLLGTGASGPPRDQVRTAIERLAMCEAPVVACDAPSGVDARTGEVPGPAVAAALTLTIGAHKVGLQLWPARGRCGVLELADIGIVDGTEPPIAQLLEPADVGRLLRPPPMDAEKRAQGTVLVLAGAPGMTGAAVLAARGALAGGAGLVTVAAPPPVLAAVAPAVPEALGLALPDDERAALDMLLEAAGRADAVVTGPGLGQGERAVALVRALVRACPAPLVLDADGLNAFAGETQALSEHAAPLLVLTPHRRELARLLGRPDEDVWPRRAELAPALAERWGAVLVAKGPGTLVAASDGRLWVNASGGPALATGGTGDVLAGLLGAVLAGAPDAARVAAAVYAHGLGGELAAREGSARSAGPVELLAALPAVLRQLEEAR